MAYRLARELDAVERDGVAGYAEGEVPIPGDGGSVAGSRAGTATTGAGVGGGRGGGREGGGGGVESGRGEGMDEDEERDAVFFRLESLGYRVGRTFTTSALPFLYSIPRNLELTIYLKQKAW